MLSVLLLGFFGVYAQEMNNLEPQLRFGTGLSIVDKTVGISASFDTRMSHLIYVSIGGFRSLDIPLAEDYADKIALRHGIWAAPSFRFPHRYSKTRINWDVFLQTGFAATFSELTEEEDWFLMEPTGLIGLEGILFLDAIAIRVGGKYFFYNPYVPAYNERLFLFRPQINLELAYTW